MELIVLEPTNLCNRSCRHCLCNRSDPPAVLPLDLADSVLAQAAALGFKMVALTGGEVALYPHLQELLRLIVARGFYFNLVTNGFRFREQVLPLLREPGVREHLTSVCFSLDGAQAKTHDGLRGPKSFREVVEGLALCRTLQIPSALKSVLTTLNLGELTELALLGARLGATEHAFLYPLPTPRLIRDGLLPTPERLNETARWIKLNLAGALRTRIRVEGYAVDGIFLNCGHLVDALHVDFAGNLIFCCTISHITMGDGIPTPPGRELVADLKEVSLKEAIVRQFYRASKLMEARLYDSGGGGLDDTPCHWCLKYFGKLDWLLEFPDSPWKAWLLKENGPQPQRGLKEG
jgi:MoaA/NifB/PqqE/SkfB family radical SAM enzyme